MAERVVKYGIFLEEVALELEKWTLHSNAMENWLNEITDAIEVASKMPADEQQARLDKALQTREAKRPEFDELLRSGKALVGKKDVTDTNQVRDKIKVSCLYYKKIPPAKFVCVCRPWRTNGRSSAQPWKTNRKWARPEPSSSMPMRSCAPRSRNGSLTWRTESISSSLWPLSLNPSRSRLRK